MDVTTSPSATITCAKPGCGAVTTLAASAYIDGCGQVCPGVLRSRSGVAERHRAAVLTRGHRSPGGPAARGAFPRHIPCRDGYRTHRCCPEGRLTGAPSP